MSRVYNFSAGPAMLPESVLQQAQQDLLNWHDSGMSVMEMSHRSKMFIDIATQAEQDLRQLLNIPDNYKVLFLQGGASAQFAMVPLNLFGQKTVANYCQTGLWSKKAIAEAKRYGQVNIVTSSDAENYTCIPDVSTWTIDPNAAYFHYTPNETIGGVEFSFIPECGDMPLVADMSSTLLSRPLDVSKFGIIYAGAQKNIGPAGLTIVIIRDDLIGHAADNVPGLYHYKTWSDSHSMYNTPPTYSWYVAGLVFKWLLDQGGLRKMAEINQRKAEKLYRLIDHSDFYHNPVNKADRSWMNVPFTLADSAQDKAFLEGAKQAGLETLKGHRSVGGMRASIYNAMPEAGVDALIDYMTDFAQSRA